MLGELRRRGVLTNRHDQAGRLAGASRCSRARGGGGVGRRLRKPRSSPRASPDRSRFARWLSATACRRRSSSLGARRRVLRRRRSCLCSSKRRRPLRSWRLRSVGVVGPANREWLSLVWLISESARARTGFGPRSLYDRSRSPRSRAAPRRAGERPPMALARLMATPSPELPDPLMARVITLAVATHELERRALAAKEPARYALQVHASIGRRALRRALDMVGK